MSERFLIVGLGNPGPQYAGTRHNIGFRCADALAEAYGLRFDGKKGKARLADGLIAGRRVLLAKPQTFMNLSGDAVSGLVNFYQIDPERILIIYDDLDLPLGALRLRKSGGAGGHNGMRSIIQRLGTQDFPRVRVGIDRPPGRMDPAAYVLRPFGSEDAILVAETVDRVVKAIIAWLSEGIDRAMNQHNGTAEEAAARQDE
ncbi:MAG: aminoacyl-tRNA hydrolase, partial [Phycisphaerae bacterium]|nr:aminoacyl-tRNA hydrolase [Phycisphaerae bacterium]